MNIRDSTGPVRLLAIVTIVAAVGLGISQFMDYRSVAVGTDLYEGFEDVVSAPPVDRAALGSAHGYAFVPAAVLALAILGFAVARRRWQLCRLITVIGLAAIAVGFAIDMPKGLDEGDATRDFEGAKASLLAGFWVQIASGASLAVASFLLGGQRPSISTRRTPRPVEAPESAQAPAPGGSVQP